MNNPPLTRIWCDRAAYLVIGSKAEVQDTICKAGDANRFAFFTEPNITETNGSAVLSWGFGDHQQVALAPSKISALETPLGTLRVMEFRLH